MAKFEDLAVRYMADLISDFSLEDFQAAAIVGSGGTESTGFTDVTENNPTSGRGGLGHFQWTGPRRRDFEAWLARNADKGWTAETYEANYSMLFRELVGPESHAIPALKQTTTLEQATESFMNKFERPGVPNLDSRISWARKALAAFVADGSPTKPHMPGTTEVIPAPRPQVDFNQILAVIHQIINDPFVRAIAAPILASSGIILPQLPPTTPTPAPEPVIIQPAPSPLTNPSVQISAAGLGITSILQAVGTVGTPFGMGESPTLAGTLSTLIPIASAVLGMTGGWGALAGGILKVLGPVLTSAASAAQKK